MMEIDIMRNNYSNDNDYYIVDEKERFVVCDFHIFAIYQTISCIMVLHRLFWTVKISKQS